MAIVSLETAELSPAAWSIRVQGQVDSSNLDRLKAAFDGIFARRIYRVVLNLSKCQYLSSSAIGCLIGGYTTAIKNGGKLVLAGTPLQVMEVLRLIGLGEVLRFVPDEPAALQQLA